jgi:hypothetical protein
LSRNLRRSRHVRSTYFSCGGRKVFCVRGVGVGKLGGQDEVFGLVRPVRISFL